MQVNRYQVRIALHTLWPIGTKRLFDLDRRELEALQPELYAKLNADYTAFADFEVCQSKIDEPGHLMWACVADIDRPPLSGPSGMLIQHRLFD